MSVSHRIGLLLFPKITQLDLAGPYEVFSRISGSVVRVHLLWKDTQVLTSEWGLELRPDTDFAECPALDVLCVPGGPGVFDLLSDEMVVSAIRSIAHRSRFVTSVCYRLVSARVRRAARWQARDQSLGFARTLVRVWSDTCRRKDRCRRQCHHQRWNDRRHRLRSPHCG